MRRSFLVLLVFIALYGIVIYHLKYRVMGLEDNLSQVNRQILAHQESIHVLNAEISYLLRPAHLEKMAKKHLDMQSASTGQIVLLASLVPGMRHYAGVQNYDSAKMLHSNARTADLSTAIEKTSSPVQENAAQNRFE